MIPDLDEVIAACLENACFLEENSLAKAKAFITAANQYVLMSPEDQSDQGSSMKLGKKEIHRLIDTAKGFVDKKSREDTSNLSAATTNVRFLSVSDGFRG